MKDEDRTKEQLISELAELRQRIAELETLEKKSKNTEEIYKRYEFITNTTKESITLINRNYTYEVVNEPYYKTKNKAQEEIIGKTVADIWGEEIFNTTIKGYIDKCFAGNKVHYQEGFKFGSEIKYFDVSYYPYYNDRETVTHVVVITSDITNRKQAEEQIKASLKEKEILLKEIHHRVKNNMQIISSLLSLQEREISNEKLSSMFKDSQNRIRSMALVHDKLYQSQNLASLNFAEYIRSLTTTLFHSYATTGKVTLAMDLEDISLPIDVSIPCGLILNELISNSLKHAFPEGREGKISISLHPLEAEFELRVSDNGVGMPTDMEIGKTKSLGLKLVYTLVEQLNGEIKLNRTDGTEFRLKFRTESN